MFITILFFLLSLRDNLLFLCRTILGTMIDKFTIDKIYDAAQIVDVVTDFITLKKRGVNYVGLCPFHDDSTPSFYVSPSKNIVSVLRVVREGLLCSLL